MENHLVSIMWSHTVWLMEQKWRKFSRLNINTMIFLCRRKKEWRSCGVSLQNARPCALADAPSVQNQNQNHSVPSSQAEPRSYSPRNGQNSPCLRPSPILPTCTRARANWAEITATTAVCRCCTNESGGESEEGNVSCVCSLCTYEIPDIPDPDFIFVHFW